jgi:DNA-binding transcriptional ArsR family regulator
MVEYPPPVLDRTFGALAHPTRRAIVRQLAHGALSVSEVAAAYPVSLASVSKHLDVLEDAGLVQRTREGRVQRCELVAEPLAAAAAWIEEYRGFWQRQLDSLSRHLRRKRRS